MTVFLTAIQETAVKDYTRAQIDAWARVDRDAWAARLLRRPTWVAVIGSSIAGFTDLEPSGHLDMMYVRPTNQRTGVASALLLAAEAAARGQGMAKIFTEASITARPFFATRGFRLIAPQIVECRGQKLINFRMEKALKEEGV